MFGGDGAIKPQHKLTRSSSSRMVGWPDPKTPTTSSWRFSGQLGGTRRRQYWIVIVVVIVIFVVLASHNPTTLTTTFNGEKNAPAKPKTHWEKPPTLAKLKQWERDLPQHNLNLPFPEGRSGRYVKFSNQVKRLGWNNAFNEMCVSSLSSLWLSLTSRVA